MRTQVLWLFSVLLFLTMTAASSALEIGDAAPEFVVIRTTDHEQTKLSDFHGKSNVILTTLLQTQPIDTTFISQLQSRVEIFKTKYDAVLIMVAPESVTAIERTKEETNSETELYSDPDSSVAAAFGALTLTYHGVQMHQPITFVIDKSGDIRWKFYSKIDADRPTMEQLESELAKLKRSIPLPVGALAPDFSLTEADGKTIFTLSEHAGKKNVLATLLLQTY
jgi:peroxiredoxin